MEAVICRHFDPCWVKLLSHHAKQILLFTDLVMKKKNTRAGNEKKQEDGWRCDRRTVQWLCCLAALCRWLFKQARAEMSQLCAEKRPADSLYKHWHFFPPVIACSLKTSTQWIPRAFSNALLQYVYSPICLTMIEGVSCPQRGWKVGGWN